MKYKLDVFDNSLSWEDNLVNDIFGHGKYYNICLSEMGKVYIHAAVNMLTAQQRAVMLCYYRDKMEQREIARKLGISSTEVYRSVARGIRRLRHPKCCRELRTYISRHYNTARITDKVRIQTIRYKQKVPKLKDTF